MGEVTRELTDELAAAKLETLGVKLDLRLAEIVRRLDELVEAGKGLRVELGDLDRRVRTLEVDSGVNKTKLMLLMGVAGLGGGGIATIVPKVLTALGG